ncbi:MAG: dihydrolipoyl dehydrogenase [Deinococcota bacterium]
MSTHDILVIGAGPGGYVAAIRAAQLGFNVGCVEKEQALGGTCLRIGCIPSKAMLESSERYHDVQKSFVDHGINVSGVELDLSKMLARKDSVVKSNVDGVDYLFKKNKITRYLGTAQLAGDSKVVINSSDGTQEVSAKHIIIATGSSSSSFPGMELDGDKIGTSTEALAYDKVPEHLVVIGGGYIGLELGSVWKRLGAEVTVVEYLDRIMPTMDAEIAKDALRSFKKQGLKFKLGCKVTAAKVQDGKCVVEIEGQDAINCDRVLIAVGRRPNTDGLGLEAVGITPDKRGFIPVDDHFQTQVPGVYAIGDVIGGAMLAHKAEEEGVACVEGIVGQPVHVNYGAIPGVAYTEPEIASVGKTEEELKDAGVDYNKGTFPYSANGRARALGRTEGKVKILADAKTDRVLGVHIIGHRAGDLIAEAVAAIEFAASAEDIARTSHAHPTLAETIKEAALAVDGRPLHI